MRRGAVSLAVCVCLLGTGCDLGGDTDERTETRDAPAAANADGWRISVTGASAEAMLAATQGRTLAAGPGKTFLVVEARFESSTPGHERRIVTGRAELVDPRGNAHPADGGGEDELCVDCGLTVETTDPVVSFRFVFELGERLPRGLAFRYAGSAPVPIPIEGEDGALAGSQDGTGWTRIETGGRTSCARDTPYAFWFRRGDPEKLLVFFQPGGGCFDVETCSPGSDFFDDSVTEYDDPATEDGILDIDNPENPFREHSILFVPSCTGDVHWGDNVRTYREGGRSVTIHHRGFVNARAALAWVSERVRRPAEVFVTGCSAGSVGSAAFAPYVIERYPRARVAQLGDSLAFVFHRPIDLEEDYGAQGNFPDWIPDVRRIAPGDFTMARYYRAIARHYPKTVFAQFNYAADGVQQRFYEAVGGDPADFPAALEASLAEIRGDAPNFRCYTAEGSDHCVLNRREFYTHETDGVPLRDWVAALAAGRSVDDVGRR